MVSFCFAAVVVGGGDVGGGDTAVPAAAAVLFRPSRCRVIKLFII